MKEIRSFRRIIIRFATALELIKGLKQIKKKQSLLLICAPISELPFDIQVPLLPVILVRIPFGSVSWITEFGFCSCLKSGSISKYFFHVWIKDPEYALNDCILLLPCNGSFLCRKLLRLIQNSLLNFDLSFSLNFNSTQIRELRISLSLF